MRVGYHVQSDAPAPADPGTAATFLDVGGDGIAQRCPERACRLYFTGRPDPSGIATRARQWAERGQRVILGNEPNLTDEGFGGGPADYAAWFLDVVNRLDPSVRCYYAGMSPSGDWRDWYTHPLARQAIARASGVCVHTYGDLDGLIDIAWWIHDQFPDKPLWISEWNWGAGRFIADVDAWVDATVEPFLDWCASIPQIEAATWFSYWWDQSVKLPTSVNAEGTSIARAITSWRQLQEDAPPMDDRTLVKLGLLYRQGSDIPEAGLSDIADLCERGGFTIISPKAADGDAYQAQFDHDPNLAIRTERTLVEQRGYYNGRRIDLAPWVVYRGMDATAEATTHAEIARACGAVIVDFEWRYSGFADRGTFDDAVSYFTVLQDLAAGAPIIFCPDPRQIAGAAYDADRIWPLVSGYAPQQYWTDFQQPALDVTEDAIATCPDGMPYWPMMPGNAEPADLDAALARVSTLPNLAGVLIFQRVGLREANLPILASWAVPQNTREGTE